MSELKCTHIMFTLKTNETSGHCQGLKMQTVEELLEIITYMLYCLTSCLVADCRGAAGNYNIHVILSHIMSSKDADCRGVAGNYNIHVILSQTKSRYRL